MVNIYDEEQEHEWMQVRASNRPNDLDAGEIYFPTNKMQSTQVYQLQK